MVENSDLNLKNTLFTQFHEIVGARLVPFAGYRMPVSFAGGIAEHNHVRNRGVGVFDVSHMGQITLFGDTVISDFERLVPSNIKNLPINHAKYTVIMNADGGMIDDCIVTKNFKLMFIFIIKFRGIFIIIVQFTFKFISNVFCYKFCKG